MKQQAIETAAHTDNDWWKTGIIYQIYPRSFQDHDGDGIGDLRGIESRLDYLVDLGIDAIWISPIFTSPMADFGYDVSDYRDIDPMFGTLADFDSLVAATHSRGLKLILDFVPSHTSHEHPWFIEARASRQSPKRDWYIWRDAKPDGSPPTNWISEFGRSAWTWDAGSGQYYLNIFLSEQPALNWRNPEVQAEMLDTLRFWYERGVDGFRVDAITHIAPDVDKGDHPPDPQWREHMNPSYRFLKVHSKHQPEGHQFVRMMRRVTDAFPGRVLIGETDGDLPAVMAYYGKDFDAFQLPFNFSLLDIPWSMAEIVDRVEAYEAALPEGAWGNWVLGNHDCARIASRAGPAQAAVATTLLLTLRGTPTLYQGDELGMESASIPPEAVQDPWEKQVPGLGLGRDPARTPMPWTQGPNRGFSSGDPWLPVFVPSDGDVENQSADPASFLSFVRSLIALRRETPALTLGSYQTVLAEDGVYVFARTLGGTRYHVCLNFTADPKACPVAGRIVLAAGQSTMDDAGQSLALAANDAVIVQAV
ncbi:alpha-amylase family glycosyl hydrolase [Tropicibacter sp. S64]|uniref:alpha-amylase family glycosyl hydrolase n=1 Tax=Tropicibacter sp. S64 TaxID=3415122 RepID=UPI003C7DE382